MRKALTYSSLVVTSFLVIAIFVTAKTYLQLGVAIILYPLLIFFALKLFPRKTHKVLEFTIEAPRQSPKKAGELTKERVEVVDVNKRTFLKLIGTAGITFFLFSFLGRRAEALLFEKGATPGAGGETLANGGYKISEVDENVITYYGFINQGGGWLIMRVDTETNNFRYAKGSADFPGNWTRRENLKYDYYYNLF